VSFREAYNDLLQLNYIEGRLAPIPHIFSAQRHLIERLESLNEQFKKQNHVHEHEAAQVAQHLHNLRARIDAYDGNVDFILRKVRSTIQLVGSSRNRNN